MTNDGWIKCHDNTFIKHTQTGSYRIYKFDMIRYVLEFHHSKNEVDMWVKGSIEECKQKFKEIVEKELKND